jgi:hypothetical protein
MSMYSFLLLLLLFDINIITITHYHSAGSHGLGDIGLLCLNESLFVKLGDDAVEFVECYRLV